MRRRYGIIYVLDGFLKKRYWFTVLVFIAAFLTFSLNFSAAAAKRSRKPVRAAVRAAKAPSRPANRVEVVYPYSPVGGFLSMIARTPELVSMEKQIADYIHFVVSDPEIPQANFGIYVAGNRMLAVNEGIRDNQVVPIASLSKPFTAVAVLTLVESGALALDSPVADYGLKIDDKRLGKITVRNLLQQRSGIPYHKNYPLFAPDEVFIYSNYNYEYLSKLISLASGMSYGEYMARMIFMPLGMSDTRAHTNAAGATGILSSARDLARFAAMLAGGGALDGHRIIQTETLQLMLQPAARDSISPTTMYYAHGFRVDIVNGVIRDFYHTGLWNGCFAEIRVFPKEHAYMVQIATPGSIRSKKLESYRYQTSYLADRYVSRVSAAISTYSASTDKHGDQNRN